MIDPAERLELLIAQNERIFDRGFRASLELVKGAIDIAVVANLIETGRFIEAFQVVGGAVNNLSTIWNRSFISSGNSTANFLSNLPARMFDTRALIIDFDQVNHRAVSAMQGNRLRMVSEFTEQQRQSTRQAITRGIREGANPREQARAFRDSIGLTRRQEAAVDNYRKSLQNLDRDALRRKLRDGRFDSTVRRAITTGQPLSKKQIDSMVNRYRQRSIKLRSETIARTEALRSVHEGSQQMYRQAIEDGSLQPEQLRREWNTALDERVRSSHSSMHGQTQDVTTPFISGLGNALMIPGDSNAPANETINCRCAVGTRIVAPNATSGIVRVSVFQ